MFVSVDGTLRGCLGVADPVKDSTREALKHLHASGVSVVMLTGDHRSTADTVGGPFGIDRNEAEVLPDQKRLAVKRLQDEDHTSSRWLEIDQ